MALLLPEVNGFQLHFGNRVGAERISLCKGSGCIVSRNPSVDQVGRVIPRNAIDSYKVEQEQSFQDKEQREDQVDASRFEEGVVSHSSRSSGNVAPKNNDIIDDNTNNMATLSDVDARVLRALLQEKKISLETEEDVRNLLERGTGKKALPRSSGSKRTDMNDGSSSSSNYSSQILQTLADTKLWRKVSQQATAVAESVGIWVSNKVEQDVKVLAALGLFAWDRAVRDVSRALPATSSNNNNNGPTARALTNTSSFTDKDPRRVLEQMNRPVDEIQSVSREVASILKGVRKSSTLSSANSESGASSTKNTAEAAMATSASSLRSVAPAGNANAGERLRRAYQNKKTKAAQDQNMPGQVLNSGARLVDTAWELQRELQSETNSPGYKTKPIRQLIVAGVTATSNVLRSVKEESRLIAAAKRQKRFSSESSSSPTSSPDSTSVSDSSSDAGENDFYFTATDGVAVDTVVTDREIVPNDNRKTPQEQQAGDTVPASLASLLVLLQAERQRIVQRLTQCVDDPANSWLTTTVIDALPNNLDFFAGPGMQESLTKMILLRDTIRSMPPIVDNVQDVMTESPMDASSSLLAVEELVEQLVSIRAAIEDLCAVTATEVSTVIAAQIRTELLVRRGDMGPLSYVDETGRARIDIDSVDDSMPLILRVESLLAESIAGGKNPKVAFVSKAVIPEIFDVIPDVLFVDVIPDAFVMDTKSEAGNYYSVDDFQSISTSNIDYMRMDANGAGLMAEIVSDDDFDNAVGAAKVAFAVKGEDNESDDMKEQDNVVLQATLRSLDVIFFIVERVVVVGLPGTVETIQTAVTRAHGVYQNGQGSVGWKNLVSVASANGRY